MNREQFKDEFITSHNNVKLLRPRIEFAIPVLEKYLLYISKQVILIGLHQNSFPKQVYITFLYTIFTLSPDFHQVYTTTDDVFANTVFTCLAICEKITNFC